MAQVFAGDGAGGVCGVTFMRSLVGQLKLAVDSYSLGVLSYASCGLGIDPGRYQYEFSRGVSDSGEPVLQRLKRQSAEAQPKAVLNG